MKKLLILCLLSASASLAQTATNDRTAILAWDANPEPDIAQYKLFASKVPVDSASGTFLAPELTIDIKPGDNGAIPTTATAAGLTDGIHYFAVIALDKAGNTSRYSNVVDLTVDATPPGAPKGLKFTKAPTAKNIENRGATIVWETQRPAHGVLLYGTSPDVLDHMEKSPLNDRHVVQLKKLDRGKIYYFSALATDPKGRIARSDIASFKTGR